MKDKSYRSWFSIGQDLESHGSHEKALVAYETAVELKPSFTRGWFHKFMIHHKLNQIEEAIHCANMVVTQEPTWIEYILKVLPDFNYSPSVEEIIPVESEPTEEEIPVAASEDDVTETESLIGYEEMMSRILEGTSKIEKIFGPEASENTTHIVADKTLSEKLDDAFKNFQEGEDIDSELLLRVPFWTILEKFLFTDPEAITESVLKEGEKGASAKIKKDPDDKDGWKLLAAYQVRLGKLNDAEATLKASFIHHSEFPSAWFMLGAIHWYHGNREESLKALEAAREQSQCDKLISKYYGYVGLKVKFDV